MVVSEDQYKVLQNDGKVLHYRVLGVDDASVDLSKKLQTNYLKKRYFQVVHKITKQVWKVWGLYCLSEVSLV